MDDHPDDPLSDAEIDAVVERCRADGDVELGAHDPRERFGWDKHAAKRRAPEVVDDVAELQKKLYAEGRSSLLMVLQGIDAAGKGGTIRSVMNGLNPAGVVVHGFGAPTEEELDHDFLWRIHHHTPRRGRIAIFDRSHYEDVLVVRVKQIVPESVWRPRYERIVDFEDLLSGAGTSVVKFFLNVSKEKQRERLQDRIDSPDERWKFRAGDLDDRALWDDYQAAFQEAIRRTTTGAAPWYVIPGDRKWVRNLAVAAIVRHHLRLIDPQYPEPEEDIEDIVVV